MRSYVILLIAVIACSVAESGAYAQIPTLIKISKAYPLTQALKKGTNHMLNYSASSGEILKYLVEPNTSRNINRHRQAQTFISKDSLAKIGNNIFFEPLLNALNGEIIAEGLLKQIAKHLLERGEHDLLLNKLLAPDAIASQQLCDVLYEVLPDFTKEEAEELFKAAQEVVNKRNKDVERALVNKKSKTFYAYTIKKDNGDLLGENGSLFKDTSNIITFGETTNRVKDRVREQTVGKTTSIVTTSKLPSGREHLDKIIMKILALTSDFRQVDIMKADGTRNTEAFVRVSSDGKEILAADQDVVSAEVAKAIAVAERSYFYRSFFSEQKIPSHLNLHYEGFERFSFEKDSIIVTLREADDRVAAFTAYQESFNSKDVIQQLANLFRAKEALHNELDDATMASIDKEFSKMLSKKRKIGSTAKEARELPLADIERYAAVLDLHDVTKKRFKRVDFKFFIRGETGIPKEVRKFFDDPTSKLNDKQQDVWRKLQELDEQRKIEREMRNLASSFNKDSIIATLRKADDRVVAFTTYQEFFNSNDVRQQLANLFRTKEALRNELDDTIMASIDKEFEKMLSKKRKIGSTAKEARELPLADIERYAAVLDLHDVTKKRFKGVYFNSFIRGRNGIPNKVQEFFDDPTSKLNDKQQDVWRKLQELDEQRKIEREMRNLASSFNKDSIIATLREADDSVAAFEAYQESFNSKDVRQKLANLFRAKEALHNELDDTTMASIDKEFSKMLSKKRKIGSTAKEARELHLAEIERQAAVLDLHDVTEERFKGVNFMHFIRGGRGIPKEVRKFFDNPPSKLNDEQKEVWQKLQKLQKLASSFNKDSIIVTLREADDRVAAFTTYQESFNSNDVIQQLANLYRAKEALRNELDNTTMASIDKEFEKMLSKKYRLRGKERELHLAEIERYAAVLDLHDVTKKRFKRVDFNSFIRGRNGIPNKVQEFFDDPTSKLNDEQKEVWQKLQKLQKLASSFNKDSIIATLRKAGDRVAAFTAYQESFNSKDVIQQLANLFRAKEALHNELDDATMASIDKEFSKMLSKKRKVGTRAKEAREISLAEIERKAAVLDLHDVTEERFKRVDFNSFIRGRNGIPKEVRKFFDDPTSKLNDEQQEVWRKLQKLDK